MNEEFDLALNTDMWDFIGSRLSFFNTDDRKAFTEFSAARVSDRTVSVSLLVVIFNLIYMYWMTFINASPQVILSMVPALAFTILLRIPVTIFLMLVRKKPGFRENLPYSIQNSIPFCESFIVIASTITIALMLIARVYNGKCSNLNQTEVWKCNPELSARALPQEFLLVLMINPLINSIVFKAMRFEFVFFSWFIVIATLFLCVAMADATQSLPAIITYIPTSLLLLFENHRQDLILFFVVKSQKKLLKDNKQMTDDQATEMRHMIANVAHDLKTPLSAFMNGVETVKSSLQAIQEQRDEFYAQLEHHNNTANNTINNTNNNSNTTNNTSNNTSQNTEKITNTSQNAVLTRFDDSVQMAMINENIKNLINTNEFMTMTINRCIDYTKASKGIKLDPRLDTITLNDIIMLPIQVMTDMQNRIAVQLTPLPLTVCSHIITDKQWLQENLFCLISNAVKYSGEGTINITTSLAMSYKLEGAKRHPQSRKTTSISDLSVGANGTVVLNAENSPHTNTNNNIHNNTHNNTNNYNNNKIIEGDEEDISLAPRSILSEKQAINVDFSFMFNTHNKHNNIRNNRIYIDTTSTAVGSFSEPTEIILHSIASPSSVQTSLKETLNSTQNSQTAPQNNIQNTQNTQNTQTQKDTLNTHNTQNTANNTQNAPNNTQKDTLNININKETQNTQNAQNNTQNSTQSKEQYDVLLFEVEDTGIGLSDEMMNSLFTPFKQAQRRAGGTGLGLYSLAKRLEALGGNYGVRRRSDGMEGSVFWFAIPYVPDHAMAIQNNATGGGQNSERPSFRRQQVLLAPIVPSSTQSINKQQQQDGSGRISPCLSPLKNNSNNNINNTPHSTPPSPIILSSRNKLTSMATSPPQIQVNQGINILVVDDSLTILKMASMLLRRQGHIVTQAENGSEALKKITAASSGELDSNGNIQIPYDIILMDFNMPVMDGLEATSRLRAREKSSVNLRRQFIVGFSANSDHDTMMEGLAAGMDDFISKPFALQTFNDVYQKHQNSINCNEF